MNPTPEERARCVNLQNIPKAREQITFEIRQAVAAARAEEREACANTADQYAIKHMLSDGSGTTNSLAAHRIAKAIRARND